MGTTAHVVVVPGPGSDGAGLVDAGEARLAQLEQRWSRFLSDSEVTRCNEAAGAPLAVSADTQLLVARGVAGWARTAGRFDPTVLLALLAAGYDDTFAVVAARAARNGDAVRSPAGPAPGCAGIVVDRAAGTVMLPEGVALDPGGFGKGLAADLVSAELLALGARGVCVNLGGDLRVLGDGPDGAGWLVQLEHPLADHATSDLGMVHLSAGAVASTWRTRRAWGPPDDRRHHIIDPVTGVPATTGIAGVVAITNAAWWAEVLATASFLSGDGGGALLEAHGAAGLCVADDGTVDGAGAIEELRPCWA
jgi:thiamine biosynthesis lipoprotein